MHTCTFTVDGYIGDRNVQGLVIPDVTSFNLDVDKQLLQLNFASKAPVFVAIETMAQITVSDAAGFVTAVSVTD